MIKKAFFALFVVCAFLFTSCLSRYEKLKRSTNSALKLEKAKQYYEKKDYFRAMPLFEELVSIYRGTKQGEEVYFLYAQCNYNLKDYISARYFYRDFAENYPKSQYTEESYFMSAYCYYKESPVYTLDQENTIKAIESFQLFVNLYPQSEKVAQCNDLIDQMRAKLEQKSFANAKLFFNIGDYKSATIAFRNAVNDYPDSKYREEMDFLAIKATYLYAKNSINTKKEERFTACIKAYEDFVDDYKQSDFMDEAQSIYEDSVKQLDIYKNYIEKEQE